MVINVINHLVDLFIESDRLIDKLLVRDHRNFSPTFYYTAGDTESRVPSDGSEISATGVTDQVSHELPPPADSETQRSTQFPRPVLTLPFLGLRQWGRTRIHHRVNTDISHRFSNDASALPSHHQLLSSSFFTDSASTQHKNLLQTFSINPHVFPVLLT